MSHKTTPNPESKMLAQAVVGGVGLSIPPDAGTPPEGMAAVLLYVPLSLVNAKSPIDIQADLGLPWSGPAGEPIWFDSL